MRIVFYTSGITGSGRVVRGICIGNALKRANAKCEYTIVNSSNFSRLIDLFGYDHIEVPVESEHQLSKINFPSSILYKTLETLKPDVLIVDMLWFNLHYFIRELTGKKIFLSHWVEDNFFYVPLNDKTIYFQPEYYDGLYAIEPFPTTQPLDEINPILIRNRSEILPRKKALEDLNLSDRKKNCLFAFNGNPGDFENNREKYSYLEKEGYDVVYSTNYQGGIFPVVDYFNAFDLIICAAGYNQFWEARYFEKNAVFENVPLRFSSTERRIKKYRNYTFEENGADQLIDIMLKL